MGEDRRKGRGGGKEEDRTLGKIREQERRDEGRRGAKGKKRKSEKTKGEEGEEGVRRREMEREEECRLAEMWIISSALNAVERGHAVSPRW